MSDNVGRTVMIAVIAGVLFAGFLALSPRLTAGSQATEPVGPASVPTTTPNVIQNSISDPVVSVPDSALFDGQAEDPVPVEQVEPTATTTVPVPTTTTTTVPSGPAPDGTLTLSAELVGPRDGKETVILEDEDLVEWYFEVENSGDEELWGVYVYLEGFGHVWCDDTYLAPGSITDCWATESVWDGAHTAHAWATAWTIDRQVASIIAFDYFVRE